MDINIRSMENILSTSGGSMPDLCAKCEANHFL
jgi:hypothetical protein